MVLVVKNSPANAGNIRDAGSVPRSGRSLGGGRGNPLQCSCLENSVARGACRAAVHGISKSQTQLKQLSTNMGTNSLSCNKDDQEDRQCPPGVLK